VQNILLFVKNVENTFFPGAERNIFMDLIADLEFGSFWPSIGV
jgi:hypothetical protein